MLDLSKEYGDIMSLFIGSKPHVVVSKYDMAKTVLSSTVFSGRPDSPVARIFFENTENIVMGNFGLLWQLNRYGIAANIHSNVPHMDVRPF